MKPVAPEGSASGAAASLLDPNPLFVELKRRPRPRAAAEEAQAPDPVGLARPGRRPAVPAPAQPQSSRLRRCGVMAGLVPATPINVARPARMIRSPAARR